MNGKKGRCGILPARFYRGTDVVGIARALLGKILCTRDGDVVTTGRIVETEAYGGITDRASHAHGGRRTVRTETMFAPGGVAYVYLCYGLHHLFNVVTGPQDRPDAVLIRGLEPLEGVHTMLKRRGMRTLHPRLAAGPGVLAQALGITRRDNGLDLGGDRVWIEDDGFGVPARHILAGPRVGVGYAGEDAKRPWRFRIKDSAYTTPAS